MHGHNEGGGPCADTGVVCTRSPSPEQRLRPSGSPASHPTGGQAFSFGSPKALGRPPRQGRDITLFFDSDGPLPGSAGVPGAALHPFSPMGSPTPAFRPPRFTQSLVAASSPALTTPLSPTGSSPLQSSASDPLSPPHPAPLPPPHPSTRLPTFASVGNVGLQSNAGLQSSAGLQNRYRRRAPPGLAVPQRTSLVAVLAFEMQQGNSSKGGGAATLKGEGSGPPTAPARLHANAQGPLPPSPPVHPTCGSRDMLASPTSVEASYGNRGAPFPSHLPSAGLGPSANLPSAGLGPPSHHTPVGAPAMGMVPQPRAHPYQGGRAPDSLASSWGPQTHPGSAAAHFASSTPVSPMGSFLCSPGSPAGNPPVYSPNRHLHGPQPGHTPASSYTSVPTSPNLHPLSSTTPAPPGMHHPSSHAHALPAMHHPSSHIHSALPAEHIHLGHGPAHSTTSLPTTFGPGPPPMPPPTSCGPALAAMPPQSVHSMPAPSGPWGGAGVDKGLNLASSLDGLTRGAAQHRLYPRSPVSYPPYQQDRQGAAPAYPGPGVGVAGAGTVLLAEPVHHLAAERVPPVEWSDPIPTADPVDGPIFTGGSPQYTTPPPAAPGAPLLTGSPRYTTPPPLPAEGHGFSACGPSEWYAAPLPQPVVQPVTQPVPLGLFPGELRRTRGPSPWPLGARGSGSGSGNWAESSKLSPKSPAHASLASKAPPASASPLKPPRPIQRAVSRDSGAVEGAEGAALNPTGGRKCRGLGERLRDESPPRAHPVGPGKAPGAPPGSGVEGGSPATDLLGPIKSCSLPWGTARPVLDLRDLGGTRPKDLSPAADSGAGEERRGLVPVTGRASFDWAPVKPGAGKGSAKREPTGDGVPPRASSMPRGTARPAVNPGCTTRQKEASPAKTGAEKALKAPTTAKAVAEASHRGSSPAKAGAAGTPKDPSPGKAGEKPRTYSLGKAGAGAGAGAGEGAGAGARAGAGAGAGGGARTGAGAKPARRSPEDNMRSPLGLTSVHGPGDEEEGSRRGEKGGKGRERGSDGKERGGEGKERGSEGKERSSEGKARGGEGKDRGGDGKERGGEGKARGGEGKERGGKGVDRVGEGITRAHTMDACMPGARKGSSKDSTPGPNLGPPKKAKGLKDLLPHKKEGDTGASAGGSAVTRSSSNLSTSSKGSTGTNSSSGRNRDRSPGRQRSLVAPKASPELSRARSSSARKAAPSTEECKEGSASSSTIPLSGTHLGTRKGHQRSRSDLDETMESISLSPLKSSLKSPAKALLSSTSFRGSPRRVSFNEAVEVRRISSQSIP